MIVRLKAGLGNQLFQYAFGQMMNQRFGTEVLYDASYFKKAKKMMDSFTMLNTRITYANPTQLKEVCIFKHDQKPYTLGYRVPIFLEKIFNKKYFLEPNRGFIDPDKIKRYEYLDGYWQSWRYVTGLREQMKNDLFPENGLSKKALKDAQQCRDICTVCVGIRLGDYQTRPKHFYIPGPQYYINAIKIMEQKLDNPTFVVFSNDIESAKDIFNQIETKNVIFREQKDTLPDYEELWVMSACKHAIIPNSTFHWWAAWLKDDPDSIIIAPDHWFGDGSSIDIIPPEWVRVKE